MVARRCQVNVAIAIGDSVPASAIETAAVHATVLHLYLDGMSALTTQVQSLSWREVVMNGGRNGVHPS